MNSDQSYIKDITIVKRFHLTGDLGKG